MTKDEIKAEYSIEDVLRRHGVPTYPGHRCKPICHDSAARSKNAIYDRTRYTCFVCGIHHDIISLEMELSSCDFQTACRLISGEDLTPEQQHQQTVRRMKQKLEAKRKADEAQAEMKLHARLREANTTLKDLPGMGEDFRRGEEFAAALAEQQICEYQLGMLR